MTRKSTGSAKQSSSAKRNRAGTTNYWRLQDAKARFSELVRKVKNEGPQHVTLHGVDAVVVISSEEYRRLQGKQTGAALVAVLQSSPLQEVDLPALEERPPIRDVFL